LHGKYKMEVSWYGFTTTIPTNCSSLATGRYGLTKYPTTIDGSIRIML
jgi:hypothetical protein